MKKSSRIVLAAVIFALLVFAAGAVLMLAKGHNDAQAREKTVFAMDTACTAKTWGADPAKICDEITRLDSVFDSHNEKSDGALPPAGGWLRNYHRRYKQGGRRL